MSMKKCLHELFQDSARKTPDKVAVVDYFGRSLTFSELDSKTSLLASYLQVRGCKSNSIIGIYMDRCLDYTVAYIGALKAGGCYLPIDYSYPIPMLNSVLEDSNPVAVLTFSEHKKWLPSTVQVICLDEGWESYMERACSVDMLNVNSSLDDLAYLVYSSGTTGAPKGIMCQHRGAVLSYSWRFENYPFEENERVASNVFFVWEMLRPLLKSITLYIIPDDVIYDPLKMLSFLKEKKITRILLTPSLLEAILSEKNLDLPSYFEHLKMVWLCGEVVTRCLRDRFVQLFPNTKLLNLYSISECHDVSVSDLSKGRLEEKYGEENYVHKFCPVGQVLEKVIVVTLDSEMKELPIGMSGEIYIGGPTLAVGYVNKPELTTKKFIKTPEQLVKKCGARLYKTGDWGYMLSNGELEICGRCDSMVKIRGFSVELQSIEAALLEIPSVNGCKVQAHGNEGEDKFLVAYLVTRDKTTKHEVRAQLKAKLPAYMIPSYFVFLQSVPLAVSGKLDSQILPKFDRTIESTADDSDEGKPKTETEEFLYKTWKTVLNLNHVDTQENFFDLGGHSLLAARMIATIRQQFNISICMSDLFMNNTITDLASFIELKMGKILTRSTSTDLDVDLASEVEYHNQSFINMDMMLRAFWRSCQHDHRWHDGRVFLTGSTGFLGAFLLKELLTSTKLHIYCLVREKSETSADERLKDNLVQYGILPNDSSIEEDEKDDSERLKMLAMYKERVTILKGDVSLLNFGLSNDDYAYLCFEIDFIIHAAAVVNLVYPYKTLHGTNVVGTRNIVMFAGSSKIKPVHYISTDAVFALSTEECHEDADLSNEYKMLKYGYAQSKWVAEQLVLKAAKGGLPTAIYRLGNVSGDSKKASWNKSDFNLMFMLTCIHNKCAPMIDFKIEMTPVNFVSEVIVSLTQQISWSMGKVYHIINTKPIDSRHFFEWISSQGYPLSIESFDEWADIIMRSNKENLFGSQILEIFRSMIDNESDRRYFDNCNLQRFLQIYMKKKYHYANSSLFKSYLENFAKQKLISKPNISQEVLRPLVGRVAIVTGASSGIGEAIACRLAQSGATVVIAARRLSKLEEIRNKLVKAGFCVAAKKADVSKRDQFKELVAETVAMYGDVDVLVNSAGVMYYTMMKNLMEDQWEQQVDVNCKGVMNGVAAVLPGMLRQESGHIINISSDAGRKVFPGLTVYSATKFFVEAFSQGLRLETANTGVKVTTIQPGDVRTSLFQLSTDEEARKAFAQTDQDAFLEPDDIANAVLFSLTQPKNCSVNEILVEPRLAPT